MRYRIWVRRDEVVDGLDAFEGARRTYYSYTYRAQREDKWLPMVRWDNWEGQDHVDRYDERGVLKDRTAGRERALKDVLSLVKTFRRNLLTIDLEAI